MFGEYKIVEINSYEEMVWVIKIMIVCGVLVIGVLVVYGMYLGVKEIIVIDRNEFLE